jgi:Fe-S cluster assembly protein SufD
MSLFFPESFVEREWFRGYRKDNFEKMLNAKDISFKYGLNISLDFNLDLTKNFDGKVLNSISCPHEAEVFFNCEMPEFFLQEDHADKIVFFNNSFFSDVLFLKIKEGFDSDREIIIERSFFGGVISKVFILAERNSRAKVIISNFSDESHYNAEDLFLILEENSSVELWTLNDCSCENFFERTRVSVGRNSNFVSSNYFTGRSNLILRHFQELGGEQSLAKSGFYFLGLSGRVYDLYGESLHFFPYSVSEIFTKGVLTGNAVSLTRSLIKIGNSAPFSDGYEKHDSLLLDSSVQSNAIPNLEINNHDVKCSHGTSAGKISHEEMFYLMSRGLSKSEAKREIIKGFLKIDGGYFGEVMEKRMDVIL